MQVIVDVAAGNRLGHEISAAFRDCLAKQRVAVLGILLLVVDQLVRHNVWDGLDGLSTALCQSVSSSYGVRLVMPYISAPMSKPLSVVVPPLFITPIRK